MDLTHGILVFAILLILMYLIVTRIDEITNIPTQVKLAIIASIVSIIAVLSQAYNSNTQDSRAMIDHTIGIVDRNWMRLLKFINDHKETTQILYREMFPAEAQLLGNVEVYPITQDEIYAAKLVVDTVDDMIKLHHTKAEYKNLLIKLRTCFRSERLRTIWEVLKTEYPDYFGKYVDMLIRG